MKERSQPKRFWIALLLLCVTGLFIFTYIPRIGVLTFMSILPQNSDKLSRVTSVQWEELTYNDPVLKNWKTVAFSLKSTITPRKKRNSYSIGDIVEVDIVVKDFLGKRKLSGGDLIQLWIKDPRNGACAAGYVEDKHNGSYVGTVKCLWAGNVTIVAKVAAPREMIKFLYDGVTSGRTPIQMKGLFRRGHVSEIKPCSPVKGRYQKICNLTTMNSDLPWYCEMPQNTSCNDWRSNAYFHPNITYSVQEKEMFKRIHQYMNIDTNIIWVVKPDARKKTKMNHAMEHRQNVVPCNKLPTKLTWAFPSPAGYLYKGVWYSTQCKSTFKASVNDFNTCLKGRKLWLLGDSTLRQFFSYLERLLHLKLTTEPWSTHAWHSPSTSANATRNITIFWSVHALPFYHSKSFDNFTVKGIHVYIDSIPAKSRDIVVIHFYLHYLGYHPDVMKINARRVIASIQALKARSPEVTIIVKGSHAYHDEKKDIGLGYDFWGVVYDQVFKEEFALVTDDVMFLDLWEITLAAENVFRHPNGTLLEPIINHMMSFICP